MSRSSSRKIDVGTFRQVSRTVTTAIPGALLGDDGGVPSFSAWITPAAPFRAPWTLTLPMGQGSFFAVLSGSCRLTRGDGLAAGDGPHHVELNAGDLVIVREGGWLLQEAAHAAGTASPRSALTGLREQETRLLCGGFVISDGRVRTAPSGLPPVVQVLGDHGKLLPWTEHLLHLLQEETARGAARAQLLIDRLFSILLANALRENSPMAASSDCNRYRKTEDEEVQQALAQIHARPEFPWTVARLADEVGLSRSGFAARFSQRVGRPPWEYLRDLRMQLASQLLREGGHGLKEIAVRTGYKTASAISTAFKRWCGVSPLEYRRAPATSRSAATGESGQQIQ